MGLADMNSGPFVNFMVHFARSFPFPGVSRPTSTLPFHPFWPHSAPVFSSSSFFFFFFSLHGTHHLWMWQPIGWSRRHFALFTTPTAIMVSQLPTIIGPPYNFSSFYLLLGWLRSPFRRFFFLFFFFFHHESNSSRVASIFSCQFAALKIQVHGNVGTFAVEWHRDVSMCRRTHRTQRGRGLVNYLCPLKRAWNISDL